MNITRGKIHKYLRMTIDYSSPGKLILSWLKYIGKMLNDILEYIKGESATPTTHQLFNIAEYETKLFITNVDLFRQFVEQLLYLPKRAR